MFDITWEKVSVSLLLKVSNILRTSPPCASDSSCRAIWVVSTSIRPCLINSWILASRSAAPSFRTSCGAHRQRSAIASRSDREEESCVAGSKAVGLPISDGALVVFLVPPGLKHLVEDCAHDNTDQRVASWSSHWSQIDRHYLLALGFG